MELETTKMNKIKNLKQLSRKELESTLENAFLTTGLLKDALERERAKIKNLSYELNQSHKDLRYYKYLLTFLSLLFIIGFVGALLH